MKLKIKNASVWHINTSIWAFRVYEINPWSSFSPKDGQSTCSKGSTIMDHKIKQNGCQKFVMSLPVLKISSIRNQAKNWEM